MTATSEAQAARIRVREPLPRASLADTLAVGATVVLPVVAQGAILRRPKVVALAERLDADRRAGRLLHRLLERYGPGPLRLPVPGRSVALILSPEHVRRVLAESPAPFALASREKRAALSHFQPDGVLVSQGRQRRTGVASTRPCWRRTARCTSSPARSPPRSARRRGCCWTGPGRRVAWTGTTSPRRSGA